MDAIFVLFSLILLIAGVAAVAIKAYHLNNRDENYDPRHYLKPRTTDTPKVQ